MSLGVQYFTPRCKKCIQRQSISSYLRREKPFYNLDVIGTTKTGWGIKMKCRNCGHQSVRYSKSARSAHRHWEKFGPHPRN